MTARNVSLLVVVAAALLLQACAPADVSGLVATGIAGTQQANALLTEAAEANLPTATPVTPEPTQAPTLEPTAQPTVVIPQTGSNALLTVTQDTNCRSGPGAGYAWLSTVKAGTQVQVLKTYSGGNYAVIADPNGSGECWLWLGYTMHSSFAGLPEAVRPPLPVVQNPAPTATPIYTWVGEWNVRVVDPGTGMIRNGQISFHRSGEVITGTVTLAPDNIVYELAGSMMPGHVKVAGDYIQATNKGGWAATMNPSLVQFSGNINGIYEICGWRAGSQMPNTCYAP
ncbi:MAG: hypothetical protein KIS88_05590 [Anaerolineales bacterium]|nr:hypothetical protein [Anaerolineales bacterium]